MAQDSDCWPSSVWYPPYRPGWPPTRSSSARTRLLTVRWRWHRAPASAARSRSRRPTTSSPRPRCRSPAPPSPAWSWARRANASIGEVVAELYHIFPLDSDTTRTPQVPTRANSPSDEAFASRDSTSSGGLTFTTSTMGTFTALNSVLNGINKSPLQTTGGEGPVTGTEVQFNVKFTNPFTLPAGNHDFFVPQVQVTGGEFYWLSSARPIVSPGTPFPAGAGVTDLQAWIRNEPLQPDWLRVGTDIVGGTTPPTFNGTFTLSGNAVPEPSSLAMVGTAALVGLGYALRRKWATATTVQA